MSVHAGVPVQAVERVLASVAELQCEARPGTVRELTRMTAMEPEQVQQALRVLVSRGAVAQTESGGTRQYRLARPGWPTTSVPASVGPPAQAAGPPALSLT